MEEQILGLLGQKDYAPANVPEMLRLLQLPPNRQQELQAELRKLEQSGQITRTKGNRYIKSVEADLIPGQIQINRQGKGFLRPDDSTVKEIMTPRTEMEVLELTNDLGRITSMSSITRSRAE